jgi:hypothetical protein
MTNVQVTKPPDDDLNPFTFEGNRKAQLLRSLQATPLQRLEWLESAMEFAYAAGALPRADVREFLLRKQQTDAGDSQREG